MASACLVARNVRSHRCTPFGCAVTSFGSPITRISAIKDFRQPIGAMPRVCRVLSRRDVQGRLVRLGLARWGPIRFVFAHRPKSLG